MNDISIDKQPTKKLKTCSSKRIIGCICLVIILAIFCAAELVVMSAIFMVFAFSYVVIAIAGGVYLAWLGGVKVLSRYKN